MGQQRGAISEGGKDEGETSRASALSCGSRDHCRSLPPHGPQPRAAACLQPPAILDNFLQQLGLQLRVLASKIKRPASRNKRSAEGVLFRVNCGSYFDALANVPSDTLLLCIYHASGTYAVISDAEEDILKPYLSLCNDALLAKHVALPSGRERGRGRRTCRMYSCTFTSCSRLTMAPVSRASRV